mgnify:CR=1 FL=1|jgi:hypothetical protein
MTDTARTLVGSTDLIASSELLQRRGYPPPRQHIITSR